FSIKSFSGAVMPFYRAILLLVLTAASGSLQLTCTDPAVPLVCFSRGQVAKLRQATDVITIFKPKTPGGCNGIRNLPDPIPLCCFLNQMFTDVRTVKDLPATKPVPRQVAILGCAAFQYL
ncbi:hypothetical protein PSTT_14145, partial [Puccinia striiformis]